MNIAQLFTQPAMTSPLAPQAMSMMTGSAAPQGRSAPGLQPSSMVLGDIAAQFMQGQQQQQAAEQARRQSSMAGGLGGMFG